MAQFERIAFAKLLTLGDGRSYVTAAEREFRISKSEGPRSRWGSIISDGMLKEESFDAVSIEWDHV